VTYTQALRPHQPASARYNWPSGVCEADVPAAFKTGRDVAGFFVRADVCEWLAVLPTKKLLRLLWRWLIVRGLPRVLFHKADG
jgi:hypothetical protein